jgi:molybdenum cofactor cytidylyltransferase
MATASILAALIGAGAGTRFGGNKLEALLDGQMVGALAATQMKAAAVGTCVAITSTRSVIFNRWLLDQGYHLITNDDPAAGMSRSIALAAREAMAHGADGLLICLADMPFVPVDYFGRLVATFARCTPRKIIASTTSEIAMPPAIFPAALFDQLATLSGDSGARSLLAHASRISVDSAWLTDIDTHEDLLRAAGGHYKK